VTKLHAMTHLAEGANRLFDQWLDAVRRHGIEIEGEVGDGTNFDVDFVFACGLLTTVRIDQGRHVEVIAAPIFPGETKAVYRSVIISSADVPVGARDRFTSRCQ